MCFYNIPKMIMIIKQQQISVIPICEPEGSLLFTWFTRIYPWVAADYTHVIFCSLMAKLEQVINTTRVILHNFYWKALTT